MKGENYLNQALVIIDAQQELLDGNEKEKAVFNKEQLIRNINLVIDKARKTNVPVVFVRDLDVAEGKGKGFEIHSGINVPQEAKIFDKKATNCFHGTELLNHLQLQEITHVVVMGCSTQHCIDLSLIHI